MPTKNLVTKLEEVLADLRKRVDSNRPMNTEELVATLLVIAEAVSDVRTYLLIKGEQAAAGAPRLRNTPSADGGEKS
jgi:hypothetical protein